MRNKDQKQGQAGQGSEAGKSEQRLQREQGGDTDLAEELVMRVLGTAASLERGLDGALSFTRGVTFSEYRLLRTLQAAEHGLTRVALAQAVSVTPSGVTRALKPLEKLGYVETVKNERDARQSLAVLTQGGQQLLSDVSGVLADFYAGLGVEQLAPDRVSTFDQVLNQLRNQ